MVLKSRSHNLLEPSGPVQGLLFTFKSMLHVSACTKAILRHVNTKTVQETLYAFYIEMPEDGVTTGRNVEHNLRVTV